MHWQQTLEDLFAQHASWAWVLSLLISIAVAIAGVVPSIFITAANLYFFGFWQGTLISMAGESLGAAISFLLYRYWFRTRMQTSLSHFPKVARLTQASGKGGAWLVIGLRLLPMVPSGLVTFAAAIGQLGFVTFVVASTVGKIPALLIEATLAAGLLQTSWPWQLAMAVAGMVLVVALLIRRNN